MLPVLHINHGPCDTGDHRQHIAENYRQSSSDSSLTQIQQNKLVHYSHYFTTLSKRPLRLLPGYRFTLCLVIKAILIRPKIAFPLKRKVHNKRVCAVSAAQALQSLRWKKDNVFFITCGSQAAERIHTVQGEPSSSECLRLKEQRNCI